MTSSTPGPKILLVDDNAVVRDMLVDLVESLGYVADAAGGGAEALALFDQNRYDIVLTDLLMPGMSGWEVLAAIRQRDPRMPARSNTRARDHDTPGAASIQHVCEFFRGPGREFRERRSGFSYKGPDSHAFRLRPNDSNA